MKTDTCPELAKNIGISTTTIDVIRAGKRIVLETAGKVAEYFGIKTNTIFEMTGKTLSDRTVLYHYRLISIIMQSAVYDEIIYNNPCKRTKAPRVGRKEVHYLEDVQAEKLLELISEKADHTFDVIIPLIIHTGMRRERLADLIGITLTLRIVLLVFLALYCIFTKRAYLKMIPRHFLQREL